MAIRVLPNHNKPWSSFPKPVPHLVARANPSAHSWFPSENRASGRFTESSVLQLHSLGSCGTQASLGPLNSIDSGKSPEVPSCFPTLPSAKVSVSQKPQQVSFVGRRVRIYTFPFELYQNGSSPCNSDNCSHPVSPLPPSFHLLLCIYPGTVYSAHSVPSNLGTAWGTRTEARKSSQTRFWQRTSGHGCSWWRGWSRGSGGLAPVTPKSGQRARFTSVPTVTRWECRPSVAGFN